METVESAATPRRTTVVVGEGAHILPFATCSLLRGDSSVGGECDMSNFRTSLPTAVLAIGLLVGGHVANATELGPDAWGYTFADNALGDGPEFVWLDIDGIGDEVTGLSSNNSVGPIDMGMTFPFYWMAYDHLFIGSGGWVGFEGNAHVPPCTSLPTLGLAEFIAPFLSELSHTGGAARVLTYFDAVDERFIISFLDVSHRSNNGTATFQLVLWADGHIDINVLDAVGDSGFGACRNGSVGLQSPSGLSGLGLELAQFVSGYSARITPPVSSDLAVVDVAASWPGRTERDGFGGALVVPVGHPLVVDVAARNMGSVAPAGDVTATLDLLRDDVVMPFAEDVAIAPPTTVGEVSVATVESTPAHRVHGTHQLQTSLHVDDDANVFNNTSLREVVAVDFAGQSRTVSFADELAPAGNYASIPGRDWAVHFASMTAPIHVDGVVIDLGGDAGAITEDVHVALHAADGPDGSPGTLLAEATLCRADLVLNTGWQTVVFEAPVTVDGQDVFAVVDVPSGAIVGYDGSPPYSRQQWWRDDGEWHPDPIATVDFKIGLRASDVPVAPVGSSATPGCAVVAERPIVGALGIGRADNVYTVWSTVPSPVDVAPSTGRMVFVHRQDTTLHSDGGDSGRLRFGLRDATGGRLLQEAGPLNPDGLSARYPGAVLYSPTSDPADERLVYVATGIDTGWDGVVTGVSTLTDPPQSTASHLFGLDDNSPAGGLNVSSVHLTQAADGVFFFVAAPYDVNNDRTGDVRVYRGVYNDVDDDVDWALQTVLTPPHAASPARIVSLKIAFSPDGNVGVISWLGDLVGGTDEVYHPVFVRSEDGGDTWGAAVEVDVDTLMMAGEGATTLNHWNDFTSWTNGGMPNVAQKMSAMFESALTVDGAGEPHLFVGIAPNVVTHRAPPTPYSFYSDMGYFLVDVHGVGGGAHQATNVHPPMVNLRTVEVEPGTNMSNEPQIARDASGEHVFFSWTAPDVVFPIRGLLGDIDFDVFVAGRRVGDGATYGPIVATRQPSPHQGKALFPRMAPVVLGDADRFQLPVVVAEYVGSGALSPVAFYDLSDQTVLSTADMEPQFVCTNTCVDGVGVAAHNGVCEDFATDETLPAGAEGCAYGTDCADCGGRPGIPRPDNEPLPLEPVDAGVVDVDAGIIDAGFVDAGLVDAGGTIVDLGGELLCNVEVRVGGTLVSSVPQGERAMFTVSGCTLDGHGPFDIVSVDADFGDGQNTMYVQPDQAQAAVDVEHVFNNVAVDGSAVTRNVRFAVVLDVSGAQSPAAYVDLAVEVTRADPLCTVSWTPTQPVVGEPISMVLVCNNPVIFGPIPMGVTFPDGTSLTLDSDDGTYAFVHRFASGGLQSVDVVSFLGQWTPVWVSVACAAEEVCGDGFDNDCNAATPDLVDEDNDSATCDVDCDDNDGARHPGAAEVCDGIDNNCNGLRDEGLDLDTVYADVDGDGAGDDARGPLQRCVGLAGYVEVGGDCDDGDPNVQVCSVDAGVPADGGAVDAGTPAIDAGTPVDDAGGGGPVDDAGNADAGQPRDAGRDNDAGPVVVDAGPFVDGGAVVDVDSGVAVDAGVDLCPVGAEGCACTGGGGCDPGLVCSDDVCVEQRPEPTPDVDDASCGCATSSPQDPDGAWGGIALLAALMWRTRRRRHVAGGKPSTGRHGPHSC